MVVVHGGADGKLGSRVERGMPGESMKVNFVASGSSLNVCVS